MILSNSRFNELNEQLHTLLSDNGHSFSTNQMKRYLHLSYQQCFNRLEKAALSEGLIDKKIKSTSIASYIEKLKTYSKHQSNLKHWNSLAEELDESIANQALALAYQHQWHKTIKQQAHKHRHLWSWLIEQFNQQEIVQFMEQWGCMGHPSHPNFRAKMGFNRTEVVQYSPEFNADVSIYWAAIHHSNTFSSTSRTALHWLLNNHFPNEYQSWNESLRAQNLNPEEYYPFLMHPWQWSNKLQQLAKPLSDTQQFIFSSVKQHTKPSMSFRTMMPLAKNAPHLKLAVGVHTTSSLRTVSPASVNNSSILSQWVNELMEQNNYYKGQLFLARDLAGINISHPGIPEHEKKHLGLIIRENPLQWTRLSQKLIPLAALFKRSPLSQKSLLGELVELSQSNPLNYFTDYCLRVLSAQLHLLLGYGVALESHQQNTLVIFQANRPSGLIARDMGGIKICTHPFYDKVAKPVLHPDSTIVCSDLQELTNKFIHGNLQSNIAYSIECFAIDFKLPPHLLWQRVRQILEHILEELRPQTDPRIHQWYRQQFLVKPWQQKCLLAMRLHENQDQDLFSLIKNPLSRDDV